MDDEPPRKRGRYGARSPSRIEAQLREGQALELRRAGASYEQIARTIGYTNASGAWKAVERAMSRAVTEPAEAVIKLEADAMDDLIRRAMEIIVRPHPILYQGKVVEVEQVDRETGARRMVPLNDDSVTLAALDRVVRVRESRRKLLGLDAPERREITGKDGEPIPLELHVAAIEQKWAQVQSIHALPANAAEVDAADG